MVGDRPLFDLPIQASLRHSSVHGRDAIRRQLESRNFVERLVEREPAQSRYKS